MKRSLKSTVISLLLAVIMVVAYTPVCDFIGNTNEGVAEAATGAFQVNGKTYDTWGQVMKVVHNGDTVYVLKDGAEFSETSLAAGITVDGQGHTMYDELEGHWLFWTGAPLVLKNVTMECKVSKSGAYGAFIQMKGTKGVLFDNVKFKNYDEGIFYIHTNSELFLQNVTFENCSSVFGYDAGTNHYYNVQGYTNNSNPVVARYNYLCYTSLGDAFAATNNNSTESVILYTEAKDNVSFASGKTATLDLHGQVYSGKLTNNGNITIKDTVGGGKITGLITNNGTMTIESGLLQCGSNVSLNNYGTVVVNGGTVCRLDNYKNVTVNGGTITTNGSSGASLYVYGKAAKGEFKGGSLTGNGISVANGATLNVSGGTIETPVTAYNDNTKINITGGQFSGALNISSGKGSIVLSGGEFVTKPKTEYLAKGYEFESTSKKYAWAVVTERIAVVGSKKYSSLTEAVEAAKGGATVELLKDCSTAFTNNGKMALNLKGHKLSGVITNKGTLTIQDSTGNGVITRKVYNKSGATLNILSGTIRGETNLDGNYVGVSNEGNLTMSGGTVRRLDTYAGGKTTITGGTFTTDGSQNSIYVKETGVVNFQGGTIEGACVKATSGGTLNVMGGTLNVTNVYVDGSTTKFNFTGTPVVKSKLNTSNSGKFVAMGGYFADANVSKYVDEDEYGVTPVKVDGADMYAVGALELVKNSGSIYGSLKTAISKAKSGDTLQLLGDVIIRDTITVSGDKTLTIDLAGHNVLSIKEQAIKVSGSSNLKIIDSTKTTKQDKALFDDVFTTGLPAPMFSGKISTVSGNAVLTIDGGVFEGLEGSTNAIYCTAGTVNVTGGTVYGLVSNGTSGKIKISGGLVSNADKISKGSAVEIAKDTTLEMSGGVVVDAKKNPAIKVAGTATIAGGIVSSSGSASPVSVAESGKLTVSDGWFSQMVDEKVIAEGLYATNAIKAGPENAPFTVGYRATLDLNFEGNEVFFYYVGPKTGFLIKEPEEPIRDEWKITGWYKDKECTTPFNFKTDGIYGNTTVYAGWRVADPWVDNCPGNCNHEVKVGNRHYKTVYAAFENAQSGQVLELMKDCDSSVHVAKDKTLTLDLCGHTLGQGDAKCAVIANEGTLIIKDSSAGKTGQVTIPRQTGTCDTIENFGKLTLEAGTIYNGNQGVGAVSTVGGIFVMNGGKVVSTQSFAVLNCASSKTTGTTTINGGEIEGYNYGIFTSGNGALLVNGGTIVSKQGWAIINGSLKSDTKQAVLGTTIINGGALKSYGNYKDSAVIYNYCGNVTINANSKDWTYPRLIGKSVIQSSTLQHKNIVKGGWYSAKLVASNLECMDSRGVQMAATDICSVGPTEAQYTVGYSFIFDNNYSGGGSEVKFIPFTGAYVKAKTDAVRGGYVLEGWFQDSTCTKPFDFSKAINSNTRVYAKWSLGSQASSAGDKYTVVDGDKQFNLTVKETKNGSIQIANASVKIVNNPVTVTLVPAAGYEIGSFFLDGNYVNEGYKSYKLTLKQDSTIAATFNQIRETKEEYQGRVKEEKNKDGENGGVEVKRIDNSDSTSSSIKKTSPGNGVGTGKKYTGGESDVVKQIIDEINKTVKQAKSKDGKDYDAGEYYTKKIIKLADQVGGYDSLKNIGGKDSNGWYYYGDVNIDDYIPNESDLTHLNVDPTASLEEQIQQAKTIVAKFKIKTKSGLAISPKGKKAIKIVWYDTTYSMDCLTGVQVFRSTKKTSGYGKKPKFTSVTKQYYNTDAKKGKTYYYKCRGYISVNGKKYYTKWSTKACRKQKY